MASSFGAEPFHFVAAIVFLCAVLHSFGASFFSRGARALQARRERRHGDGHLRASLRVAILHELGEVESVFGVWAVVLFILMALYYDWHTAVSYFSGLDFKEPVFVVVIMSIAASRPIVASVEKVIRSIADLFGGSPGSFWLVVLIIGPLLGSIITEPAAMTICAILLSHRFYEYKPSLALRYATIGLLFVNISVGGTLTHFAAPPVLMVAASWNWSSGFMLTHFGGKGFLGIVSATLVYRFLFWREFARLAEIARGWPGAESKESTAFFPRYLFWVHAAFLLFVIVNSHYPVMVIGAFCFYLAFVQMTHHYQHELRFKSAFMVGFFLAGLVIHGSLQGWWISPLLQSLDAFPLYCIATLLTSVVDNALITYLSTLVDGFTDPFKYLVVAGALTGGGLTLIANAPNPAGRALLARYFPSHSISPLYLALAAAFPTLVVFGFFWWLR